MALNHDDQGFLAGERLGRDEVSAYLESIRDEIQALRRDLADDSRPAPPRTPATAEGAESRQGAPQAPPPKTSEPQRDALTVSVELDATEQQPPAAPARPAGHEAAPSRQSPQKAADVAVPARASSSRQAAPATPIAPQASGPQRDSRGRFIGSQSGGSAVTPDGDAGDEGGGRLSMAIDGLGERLSGAVEEMGAGTGDADPTVKAFNEVAEPLSRGFGAIAGSGRDRKQERWYRRFWMMMRGSRREDRAADKRQQRLLKNIERKPVADGGGSLLWRGLMLLLAPLATMASLLVTLPATLAGAVLGGLKRLLTVLGMGGAAIRIPVPGRGRGSQRTVRGSAATAGQSGRQGRMPGSTQPGSGSRAPGRAARIGGMLKGGARRIPGIGALLGLGFMASDIAASENRDASREEKNISTGRAIGGGLGGLGGMAGGAAAGAAIGSVVPGLGTAIGGIVGAAAGGFFGGSAGEVVGEKAGSWLNNLEDSQLFQGMAESWHYASDVTSSLWESASNAVSSRWDAVSTRVGDGWERTTNALTARWEAVTGQMKERWGQAVDLAAKGWEALTGALGGVNDWIAEKTGIDVADTASRVAEGARDIAVDVGTRVRDGASSAAETVSNAASSAAESVREAGSSAWGSIKGGFGAAADWLGNTAPVRAVSDAMDEAGARRRARRNVAAAEPALTQAMAEAGITDPNEQAAFMGQMHHESNGFRSMEESFNYSSADRIMSVSRTAREQGPEAVQAAMAQGPEAVAELMYGGRMGNTEAGDGYRFRGRGYTQLTGRDNYEAASEALGIDLVNNPDMAADPEVAAKVATWFWQSRDGLSEAAQRGDTREVTRLINGGTNGLADRQAATEEYLAAARSGEFATGAPAAAERTAPARAAGPVVAAASPVVRTDHLTAMGVSAPRAPAEASPQPAVAIAAPRMPAISEAPTVSAPLTHGGQRGSNRGSSCQKGEDVSRDVSDRRIAHIVTGAYSGMA